MCVFKPQQLAVLSLEPDSTGENTNWKIVCVHTQSYALVFECLIHQPLSDTGDETAGISSPRYTLITVSWNTWENYISLLWWSADDKGNDGVLCVKDRRGWIQEALITRADDRRDTRILWCYTTGAPQVVCKCDGGERATSEIQPDRNTRARNARAHSGSWSQRRVCAQHAPKSHTNRQLPAACCACVIVTLWGSVSRKRVNTQVCLTVCVLTPAAAAPRRISRRRSCWVDHITANHAFIGNWISLTHWGDCTLTRALSFPANCVSNWKSKRKPFFFSLRWALSRATVGNNC